jgi:glyoxylase-like metal-dependent hydrolase (beta-lactamase superfamily II)
VQEIVSGIYHWTAFHKGIGMLVSCQYVEQAGALIDPMVPEEGLEVFDRFDPPPQQVLLTTRLHNRGITEFADRFGVTISCSTHGLHEYEDSELDVQGFDDGDEVAPGITVVATNGISPDDVTLHIAHGEGALAFGDGLVRPPGGPLGFVPDSLIGDDPPKVKAALYDAYRGLLERDFDTLLFAHGEPLASGGYAALKEFVSAG